MVGAEGTRLGGLGEGSGKVSDHVEPYKARFLV